MTRSIPPHLAGLALAVIAAYWSPSQGITGSASLLTVRNWAYQLQGADPREIAASPFDLVVIDYSRDGSEKGAYALNEVQAMQRKADRRTRVVLSYMSIGEAEDYRYYWKPQWKTELPAWLGEENPDWPGNYKVRYWTPEWQALIFGHPNAYLDKIIAAGFDGVYLDIIDAFEYYESAHPTAAGDMVDFVVALSAYAKSKKPDFLIFPQNGEILLESSRYLAAVDGIGKEELFYTGNENSHPNTKLEIDGSMKQLEHAAATGKLVLTVEYLINCRHIRDYRKRAAEAGFLTYVAHRSLEILNSQVKF
jgi:cysteinyl-tRNA synthetase, unknown class